MATTTAAPADRDFRAVIERDTLLAIFRAAEPWLDNPRIDLIRKSRSIRIFDADPAHIAIVDLTASLVSMEGAGGAWDGHAYFRVDDLGELAKVVEVFETGDIEILGSGYEGRIVLRQDDRVEFTTPVSTDAKALGKWPDTTKIEPAPRTLEADSKEFTVALDRLIDTGLADATRFEFAPDVLTLSVKGHRRTLRLRFPAEQVAQAKDDVPDSLYPNEYLRQLLKSLRVIRPLGIAIGLGKDHPARFYVSDPGGNVRGTFYIAPRIVPEGK